MSGTEKGSVTVDENDIWVCRKCGWTYPNPHPSAKHRRKHRKHCKGAAEKKQAPVQEQQENGSSENVSSEDEEHQAQAAVVVEQSPTEKQPAVTEESKKTELLKNEEQPAAEFASTDAPKGQEEVTPETVSDTSSGPPPAQTLEEKASHQDVGNTESSASIPEVQRDLEPEINHQVKVLEEVSPRKGFEQGGTPLQAEQVEGGVDGNVQGDRDNSVPDVKEDPVEDHSKAVPLPTHGQVAPDSNVQGDSGKEGLQESVPNSSQQVKELSSPQPVEADTLSDTQSTSDVGKPSEETQKEPETESATKVPVPEKVQEERVRPQGRRDSWEQLLDADAQLGEQPPDVLSKTANDQPSSLPVQTNDATEHQSILNGNPFVEPPQAKEAPPTDSAPEKNPFVRSVATGEASSSTSAERENGSDIKPHVPLKSLFEDDPRTQEAVAKENNEAASTKRNSNVFTKVLDTIRGSPAKVKDNNQAKKEEEEKPKSRWSSFICCG